MLFHLIAIPLFLLAHGIDCQIRAPDSFLKILKGNLDLNKIGGSYSMGSTNISALKITGADFEDLYFDNFRNDDMIISIGGLSFSVLFRYSVAEKTPFFTYRDSGTGAGSGKGGVRVIFGRGNQVWCDATQLQFQLQLHSERSRLRSFLTNAAVHIRQRQVTESLQGNICSKVKEELLTLMKAPLPNPPQKVLPEVINPIDDIFNYVAAVSSSVDTSLALKYQESEIPDHTPQVKAIFQRSVSHACQVLSQSLKGSAELFGDIGVVVLPVANLLTSFSDLLLAKANRDSVALKKEWNAFRENIGGIGNSVVAFNTLFPKYVGSLIATNFHVDEFEDIDALNPFVEVLEQLGESLNGEGSGMIKLLQNIGYEIVFGLSRKIMEGDDEEMVDEGSAGGSGGGANVSGVIEGSVGRVEGDEGVLVTERGLVVNGVESRDKRTRRERERRRRTNKAEL